VIQRILKSFDAVFSHVAVMASLLFLSSFSLAQAPLKCAFVHETVAPYSLEWRVERQQTTLDSHAVIDLMSPTQNGSLTVAEQPLSPQSRTALMELIRMVSMTRAVKFSFKEFQGKEIGKLILALPLENNYSVEITYKSDYRTQSSPRYTISSMELITPSGKAEFLRKNMQNVEGGLDSDISFDLSDYPSLAKSSFKLHVPVEITGEALSAFASIAPKLELLTKQELNEISTTNNYFKLKTLVHYRAAKALIKNYLVKGPFKTFYKLVIGIPFIFFVSGQVNTHFHPQLEAMKSLFVGDQSAWVTTTLERASESDRLPSQVRTQLQQLIGDVQHGQQDKATTAELKKAYPPDLNTKSKFQISREQYLWIESVYDKDSNKERTLLFLTQDDHYGKIQYSVTVLDPHKYSLLINYVQSRGSFLPLPTGTDQP
jgi:hypothetical protein